MFGLVRAVFFICIINNYTISSGDDREMSKCVCVSNTDMVKLHNKTKLCIRVVSIGLLK